jgi:hypothetical protein
VRIGRDDFGGGFPGKRRCRVSSGEEEEQEEEEEEEVEEEEESEGEKDRKGKKWSLDI